MKTLLIVLIATGLRSGGVDLNFQEFDSTFQCEQARRVVHTMNDGHNFIVKTECLVLEE